MQFAVDVVSLVSEKVKKREREERKRESKVKIIQEEAGRNMNSAISQTEKQHEE